MHSFYLESESWREPFALHDAEAKHLIKVLRAEPGQTIRLFDGLGHEGIFRIDKVGKKDVGLTPVSIEKHPEPVNRTFLAAAWSKSIRRGWFFEKAVELGASGIHFWQADHSQGQVPDEVKETWLAQCIAGAKQSNNPYLPEIKVFPKGLQQLQDERHGFDRRLVLWEKENSDATVTYETMKSRGDVLFIIGPEGGFSEKESDLIKKAGLEKVSLGETILRWETAAMLCLGIRWWALQTL